ncbi:hypothetical protein CCHR01_05503 [Colletotrichum chrysophilum]|uniref:Uncharacterized protein n=1 Tax=Colletotrichum chrysophilum TaxID=1836956 RepID=A0AAD9AQ00_9PEZI|nr:hypothetical protein CCHR01_05503 [Colletotrichum chrysophilum]
MWMPGEKKPDISGAALRDPMGDATALSEPLSGGHWMDVTSVSGLDWAPSLPCQSTYPPRPPLPVARAGGVWKGTQSAASIINVPEVLRPSAPNTDDFDIGLSQNEMRAS